MEEGMRRTHRHLVIGFALFLFACLWSSANPAGASQSPQIVDGSKVVFLYVISIPGDVGVEIRDIGQFTQGKHEILPSLEREMDGMKAGEEKRVELSAEQGFGTYDDTKKKQVARTVLPEGTKEGDILQDREGKPAVVMELSDSAAVLDYNHPLAGKLLFVQIKVLQVEDPS